MKFVHANEGLSRALNYCQDITHMLIIKSLYISKIFDQSLGSESFEVM